MDLYFPIKIISNFDNYFIAKPTHIYIDVSGYKTCSLASDSDIDFEIDMMIYELNSVRFKAKKALLEKNRKNAISI